MSKPILKAVSKFLARSLVPDCDIKQSVAYVYCAKDLIDALIAENEPEKETVEIILEPAGKPGGLQEVLKEALEPPPKPKLQAPVGDYAIIVDKDQKLVKIEGLSQDATIELDGTQYFHKDAIGKKFKQGKVIDDGS